VDGVLFDKSQTTLIQCPAGKTGGFTRHQPRGPGIRFVSQPD
jgi:hypothetical protein